MMTQLRCSIWIGLLSFAGLVASTPSAAQEEDGIQFAPDSDSTEQSDMMYKDDEEQSQKTPEAQATPTPAATTDGAATTATPPTSAEQNADEDLSGGRRDVLFGSHRIRFGFAKPDFTKVNFYDKLYGNEGWYPTLAADWFFWDWYATLGFSFRGGYYTADGHAAKDIGGKNPADVQESDIVIDDNSPLTLTLIPLQACFTAEITPLRQKWLVVDGYIGLESLYWQEVRGSTTTSSMIAMADSSDDSSDDTTTNRGTQKSTVLGVSANIKLNAIDEQSTNSLRSAMGLGNIYLSPFLEYVQRIDPKNTASKRHVDFSRKTMGIAFTFESIR